MAKIELAPSILSANFAQLGVDAKAALDAGAQVVITGRCVDSANSQAANRANKLIPTNINSAEACRSPSGSPDG